MLVVETAVLLLLTVYLDQVLPSPIGVKKHPLFFLGVKSRPNVVSEEQKDVEKGEQREEPADVKEERRRTNDASLNPVVRISNLRKEYPMPNGPPKVAVKNLSLSIEKGECFGF